MQHGHPDGHSVPADPDGGELQTRSRAGQAALADVLVKLGPCISANEDDETFDLAPEAAARFFFNDCDPTDIALALRLLTPEPNAPATWERAVSGR
ncbi:hypothetical protein AB0L63_24195 [Nocardia sp. NPDC051990]|uniref:hypothetical protein n=1 Tax=Nocardia sp. NPDC051990 TaxID=3155285 RepID=UPI003429BB5F